MGSCESEEECRNMVAECLGHVALLYPDKALPLLQQQSQVRSQDAHDNPTPKRRRTVRACASFSPMLCMVMKPCANVCVDNVCCCAMLL